MSNSHKSEIEAFYQCSQHFGASQNFLTSKEDQISEKESQEPTFVLEEGEYN